MSEYIPLEVQEKILNRLPVKPLVQFRSVSITWKSLIVSPEFIAAYGVRETHPNRFILTYKGNIDFKERYLTFIDNDNDDHSFITKQDFVPTVPSLIKDIEPHSVVVGSSRGLLCFNGYYKYPDGHSFKYEGTEIVVLWNPSISKSIGIEVSYTSDLAIIRYIGFGVCPVTFDPTILKIQSFLVGVPWKVEVFTLSTGTWSVVSTNLSHKAIRLIGSQVVIDRFIYWLAFDFDIVDGQTQSRFLIMSFDLTAKELKEINLTGSLTNPLCRIHTISKLWESLVLLAYHIEFEADVSVCCLWMMKEQGDSRAFTKLYTINRPDAIIKTLLGFRKTGELIVETQYQNEENSQLEIYNPNSNATDNLGIDGDSNSFLICLSMETLLLLDHLDGFIYSSVAIPSSSTNPVIEF